jgi:hypothetical protein
MATLFELNRSKQQINTHAKQPKQVPATQTQKQKQTTEETY